MLCPSQLHLDTSDDTRVTKQNGNPFNCNILLGNRHRALREISLQNAQIPIGFYNIRAPYNTFQYNSTNYTINPGNYNTISELNSATIHPDDGREAPLSTLGQFSNTSPTIFTPAPLPPDGTIQIDNTNNVFTVRVNEYDGGGTHTQTFDVTIDPGSYNVASMFNDQVFSASPVTSKIFYATFDGTNYIWSVNTNFKNTVEIIINFDPSIGTAIGTTVAYNNIGYFTPGDDSTVYGYEWGNSTLHISSRDQAQDSTWLFNTVAGGSIPGQGNFGTPTPNSFLYFMGYTPTQVLYGLTIPATYNWILNFDNYVTIWIENLAQSSQETNQITFKIPMNNVSSNTIYWSEASQNEQKIVVSDRGPRVDRLNVTVRDFLGYVLNNNGLDWSFSMDILSLN